MDAFGRESLVFCNDLPSTEARLAGLAMRLDWHDGPTHASFVLHALARFGERTAFMAGKRAISYRAARDLIGRMQAAMVRAGIGRGDVIAGLSSNNFEAWCASVACNGLGAATTSLHPLGSHQDHLDQIADSGATALILDPAFGDRAGQLCVDASVPTTLVLGPASFGKDLIAEAMDASFSPKDLSRPNELAIINYTGGTTGRPKGVRRSHRELTAGSIAVLANFPLPKLPVYLAAAPISHAAGMFITPVLARGGTVDLMSGFEPDALIRRLLDSKANMSLLVPSMIYALLDHTTWSRADLTSLELLLYGASPIAPSRLEEGLDRIGQVFCQLYGQTECFGIASLRPEDHSLARPELLASAGHPLLDCEVCVLDDSGLMTEAGIKGEICVRAPYAMQGYWNQPDLTAATIKDGWICTGDIGWQDEEGRLFIVDRKKEMVISGGFNVFPSEVENVLNAHPAIAGAAVIGVPDNRWGEAVKAYIVIRPGYSVSQDDLASWVRSRKGPAHVPKSFEVVGELPLTSVGKIDKKALRSAWWDPSERQVS